MFECLFNKAAGLQACNFIEKKIQPSCFPVKFAKLLRIPILKKRCERVLLENAVTSKNASKNLQL